MPFKIRLYVIDYNQEPLLLLCVTERSTGFFNYHLERGNLGKFIVAMIESIVHCKAENLKC